jgi:manganese efflux pump family protein
MHIGTFSNFQINTMGIIPLLILGIGLSFDTFAVSVSCGIVEKEIRFIQAVRIAIFFAVFQAFMPIIGWLLGYAVKSYIEQFDHWIAFALLTAVGIKMILESFQNEDEKSINPHDIKVILTLSFATTIDALVVGITFAFLNINLPLAALIIGTVTFIVAMLGMLFGKKVGSVFGKKMEIVGGLILMIIGIKILIEHLMP